MHGAAAVALPGEGLESFLDGLGLGRGPVRTVPIGEGASNLTYLLERDGARLVLRRPPPPPWPPSAHDVIREARIQLALAPLGVRVPRVLAVCEDESVLGVPFYLMEELRGSVLTERLPAAIDTVEQRRRLGDEVLDALVALHAVDWERSALQIGRPTGYLERQLRRWSGLWEVNATRELPACVQLGERLRESAPASPPSTFVHGDYRVGNLMVSDQPPARLLAILDWEMATIGDPLADLGYLVVGWSEAGAAEHPLLLTPATARRGFPTRAELIARYAERSGRDVSRIGWYQAFALWKAAVFCEAIYGRYLRGERSDPWSGSLCDGVPRLLEVAAGYL
ncbi:MAG: phosphotransferase family protein [Solirubrobacterales bacterium]|nr:phosphotransferase family protein [Solirubrobacterales bacterium]